MVNDLLQDYSTMVYIPLLHTKEGILVILAQLHVSKKTFQLYIPKAEQKTWS